MDIICQRCGINHGQRTRKPLRRYGSTFRLISDDYIVCDCGCWIWRWDTRKGYPYVVYQRRKVGIARLVLGIQDADLVARHRCDNPICVNPAHLVSGSTRDNADDVINRNRLKGVRHPRAVLTDLDVLTIRASSDTLSTMAKRYGVSIPAIRFAKTGHNWRHI